MNARKVAVRPPDDIRTMTITLIGRSPLLWPAIERLGTLGGQEGCFVDFLDGKIVFRPALGDVVEHPDGIVRFTHFRNPCRTAAHTPKP